ncbi:hypothetical protein Ares1_0008 [Vibrio phage Ares1]|nr:hypothetical protein Ares1_0008 [Vibrio phage Ares1]
MWGSTLSSTWEVPEPHTWDLPIFESIRGNGTYYDYNPLPNFQGRTFTGRARAYGGLAFHAGSSAATSTYSYLVTNNFDDRRREAIPDYPNKGDSGEFDFEFFGHQKTGGIKNSPTLIIKEIDPTLKQFIRPLGTVTLDLSKPSYTYQMQYHTVHIFNQVSGVISDPDTLRNLRDWDESAYKNYPDAHGKLYHKNYRTDLQSFGVRVVSHTIPNGDFDIIVSLSISSSRISFYAMITTPKAITSGTVNLEAVQSAYNMLFEPNYPGGANENGFIQRSFGSHDFPVNPVIEATGTIRNKAEWYSRSNGYYSIRQPMQTIGYSTPEYGHSYPVFDERVKAIINEAKIPRSATESLGITDISDPLTGSPVGSLDVEITYQGYTDEIPQILDTLKQSASQNPDTLEKLSNRATRPSIREVEVNQTPVNIKSGSVRVFPLLQELRKNNDDSSSSKLYAPFSTLGTRVDGLEGLYPNGGDSGYLGRFHCSGVGILEGYFNATEIGFPLHDGFHGTHYGAKPPYDSQSIEVSAYKLIPVYDSSYGFIGFDVSGVLTRRYNPSEVLQRGVFLKVRSPCMWSSIFKANAQSFDYYYAEFIQNLDYVRGELFDVERTVEEWRSFLQTTTERVGVFTLGHVRYTPFDAKLNPADPKPHLQW